MPVGRGGECLGGFTRDHDRLLLSGLRGAADRDGDRQVTLPEAYAFAYHLTLFRSARSAGVLQRPATELALEQQAPVVLTYTTSQSSIISLPREADTQYLVYAVGARAVVAEIWGYGDRTAEVGLSPGRFFVHRRGRGQSGIADVVLARGERRQLRTGDFKGRSGRGRGQKGW